MFDYNPAKDCYVERQSAAEIERDALREKARLAQLAKEERAKKARFDHLPSIKDLSLPEFADMRKRKMYDLPRNSNDLSFHRREQQLICTELYAKLTHKVCPQKVVDFEHLRKSDYFKEALWITEKLGLHPLMQLKKDYNILLVHQFFATLVFGDGEELPMTWMTGDQVIHSNFIEFAEELGYPFKGNHMPCGTRMHLSGVAYNKKALSPLYGKLTKDAIDQGKKIVVGDSYGLRTRSTTFSSGCFVRILPQVRVIWMLFVVVWSTYLPILMKSFARGKKLKWSPLMSWISFTGKCMSASYPRKPRSMLRM
jgi:hypothetical protein